MWRSLRERPVSVLQIAHGFSVGEALYFHPAGWTRAGATDDEIADGLVTRVVNDDRFEVAPRGTIVNPGAYTAGQRYWLDTNTKGALTPIIPGNFQQQIGVALSDDRLYFDVQAGVIMGSGWTVNQPGHGFDQGTPIHFTGVLWDKAVANDMELSADGLADVIDADNFRVAQYGYLDGFTGLTPGQAYYLARDVAGTWTPTPAVFSGGYLQRLFIALSSTEVLVAFAGQLLPEIIAYNARDADGGISVSTTPVTLPLDTEYFSSPYFSLSGGAIVVGVEGVFELSYQVAINFSASPGASEGAFEGWFDIDYNQGGGWQAVTPSVSSAYWSKNTDVFTLTGTWMVPLIVGAQIRLRARLTTATHTSEPERCWINVNRLGPFATPIGPVSPWAPYP